LLGHQQISKEKRKYFIEKNNHHIDVDFKTTLTDSSYDQTYTYHLNAPFLFIIANFPPDFGEFI
jgi:hypothetical protein